MRLAWRGLFTVGATCSPVCAKGCDMRCANSACVVEFEPAKNQKYCSPSCRNAVWKTSHVVENRQAKARVSESKPFRDLKGACTWTALKVARGR
jgi:hypothetical protein